MVTTLSQVAEKAGVSVSVASRSLNGHAKAYRISDATASRVKEAADQLGFRPSQTARSLRLKKTGLVGVVVPDLSNPFFASISQSIALSAEAEGYSVIVADSREQTEHEIRLLHQLEDRQVEALVVCPVGTESKHLQEINKRGTPVVLADRTFPNCNLAQVTSEHRVGAAKATRLLTAQGHRVIGVLQGLPGTLPNEQRLSGHAEALEEIGVAFDPSLTMGNNFTEASGFDSAKKLLVDRPDITAFFAFSTPNAMGALRAAMESSRLVPDDLSIVAFDDCPYADLMSVPLTTVRQDVDRIGQLAAELALRAAVGSTSRKRKRRHDVKTRVIVRNSISSVRHS
ncbi:LacI family DNA-binding transcriptional regulator [Aporhodopirellula aestuarii]|uniref:LacI family transcriptional regulator n=1 Tax=Aporhodopirellula aestuarii TaxID=2950107 RepID=A0ABT0TXZ8_9BACT|nr:LacI family DNA-binding transcriptional regulator [Aporhodopirellula aestuarii]MCM2369472.1 LacI family transcriptional regulator [Aporhodopirellula aestuarii]